MQTIPHQIRCHTLVNASICVLAVCGLSVPQAQDRLDASREEVLMRGSTPVSEQVVAGDAWEHGRVWERVSVFVDTNGDSYTRTNVAYVQLEDGLNYLQDGRWLESTALIVPVAGGAAAQQGGHKVIFTVNLNRSDAVQLQLPDGQWLRTGILGLSYFDTSSGKSILIAEIKDCVGEIVGDNQVIYDDAFTDFKAAVRYTYTKAGFEQDILLLERPPAPEEFGLNSATTRLQVLTEVLEAPPATVQRRVLTVQDVGEQPDEMLDFGTMRIGTGAAFSVGGRDGTYAVPVGKQFQRLDGRDFLIEEVQLPAVDAELQELPEPPMEPGSNRPGASLKRSLPARRIAAGIGSGPAMGAVRAWQTERALVLDYLITLSNQSNYTLKCDTTYYVSGVITLSGTTVVEGGTVVKYSAGASLRVAAVDWRGTQYRPVVFTAKDDNSVGDIVGGSTGSPVWGAYANPALDFSGMTSIAVSNFRVAYAQKAIKASASSFTMTLTHAQIVNCATAFYSPGQGNLYLRNLLVAKFDVGLNLAYANAMAEHVTFDGRQGTSTLLTPAGSPTTMTLKLTNSIVSNVTVFCPSNPSALSGDHNGFYPSASTFGASPLTSGTSPFEVTGAGSYYLAAMCPFRDQGLSSVNSSLVQDLALRTTWPPTELTADVTVDTSLAPSAPRDSGSLDLGYHYDPLDYVANGRLLSASLSLTGGVVLGTYGYAPSWGIKVVGGSFSSEGTPNHHNWIVRYNTSQEQTTSAWSASSVGPSLLTLATSPPIRARFTSWSMLGGAGDHFRDNSAGTTVRGLTDCNFGGGQLTVSAGSVGLTNCIWERTYVTLNDQTTAGKTFILFNNTFVGGTLWYGFRGSGPVAVAYDNLFDRTAIIRGSGSEYFVHDYNGYVSGQSRLNNPYGAHDVIIGTSTTIHADGPLGRRYQALSDLIDKGSRLAANAGLYHFTVLAPLNTKDSSYVDIGFHYAGLDGSGNPIDTDGDGLADYAEDANGNGSADAGEANWQISRNGTTGSPGSVVYTPLQ